MTEQKTNLSGMVGNIRAWLDRNNWAYWAIAILGVVGVILVLTSFFKDKTAIAGKGATTQ